MIIKKATFSLLLMGIGSSGLYGQESVTTTGGDASGTGGSSSYSIGQIAYHTYNDGNNSAAEGVQQPQEVSVYNSIEDLATNVHIDVFPNPTVNFLTIKAEQTVDPLSIQLFDLNGKILLSKEQISDNEIIDMSTFENAYYLLEVQQQSRLIKTYKIIKTH